MPYFTYEAREKSGKLVRGQAFVSNKRDLISKLQNENLLIVSLKETATIAEYKRKFHKKAAAKDLMLFGREFKVLLENGIPIMEALDVLSRQMSSVDLIDVVKKIKKDIENGSTLHDAITKYPRIFGPLWQYLIEAGEISGQMPFVMEQIAALLESMENVRKKTINAMIYPALLLIVSLVAVLIFVFKLVPIFKGVYATLGSSDTSLPFLTAMVFTTCDIIRQHFIYIFLFFTAIALTIKQIIATKNGRRVYENMVLSMPILGNLYLSLAIQKFATTLMVLLKSGILIIKAMEMAANTAGSKVFSEKIDEVKVKVTAGLPFSEALQQTGFFPPLVVELVTVGEKTGNYPKMFEEISKYYGNVVDTFITRFTALIEPVMLVLMAVVIGTLVIAMYLPIFKLANL